MASIEKNVIGRISSLSAMASSASEGEREVESKTKRRKKAIIKSHTFGIMVQRSVMRAACQGRGSRHSKGEGA